MVVVVVVGHCKARGTAAGVQLPVTLAVACSIIYADLNLMEHMCVSAADILPRLARKAGARRTATARRNARPRRAYDETLSLICIARTHTIMHVRT